MALLARWLSTGALEPEAGPMINATKGVEHRAGKVVTKAHVELRTRAQTGNTYIVSGA